MRNGNQPAFPVIDYVNIYPDSDNGGCVNSDGGLTKREYFAALAMQGMLAACNGFGRQHENHLAECAVSIADALLAELSKGAK